MRRIWIAVASAALAIAGCGGGSSASGGVKNAELKRAADKATKAGSYRAEADFTATGSDGFDMTGDMVGTTDGSRSRILADVDSGDATVKMEMLTFGSEQYLRSEAFAELMPKGREWVLTTDETPTSQMPIGDFFKYLGGSDGFDRIGTEEVRGKPSTHYGGPFDLEDFVKYASPQAARGFKVPPGLDVRLDVWIDEQAMPSRLRMDMKQKGKKEALLSVTLDFVEFGVPADFERPDPSKVADESVLD